MVSAEKPRKPLWACCSLECIILGQLFRHKYLQNYVLSSLFQMKYEWIILVIRETNSTLCIGNLNVSWIGFLIMSTIQRSHSSSPSICHQVLQQLFFFYSIAKLWPWVPSVKSWSMLSPTSITKFWHGSLLSGLPLLHLGLLISLQNYATQIIYLAHLLQIIWQLSSHPSTAVPLTAHISHFEPSKHDLALLATFLHVPACPEVLFHLNPMLSGCLLLYCLPGN